MTGILLQGHTALFVLWVSSLVWPSAIYCRQIACSWFAHLSPRVWVIDDSESKHSQGRTKLTPNGPTEWAELALPTPPLSIQGRNEWALQFLFLPESPLASLICYSKKTPTSEVQLLLESSANAVNSRTASSDHSSLCFQPAPHASEGSVKLPIMYLIVQHYTMERGLMHAQSTAID